MPILYRPSPLSVTDDDESDLENVAPHSSNPDDTIVLSDLVRTGEASRLRRRGAMRLDHNQSNPFPVIIGRSPSSSDQEDAQSAPVLHERLRTVRAGRSRRVGPEELTFVYSIFCGAEEYSRSSIPFKASPLPILPSLCPSSSFRRKRSNGCGAILHLSAAPRQNGTWIANDEAMDVVVQLDASYFEEEIASKISGSSCGCLKGIGCAVCGNPLGIRYRACKTSGHGNVLFPRHKPPAMTFGPDSPRYWRTSSSHRNNSHTIYTFFANAVSWSPPHEFPAQSRGMETRAAATAQDTLPSENHRHDGLQPTYNNTIFDRVMVASPIPLSELGEDDGSTIEADDLGPENTGLTPLLLSTQGHRLNESSLVLDPDGEHFDGEPNSPDKTNSPLLLFPER